MAYVTVNDETCTSPQEYTTVGEIRVALTGAKAPRAFIVSLDLDDGKTVRYQPVMNQYSVLDIRTELISHLADYPHTDGWLQELRDYLDARLAARSNARRCGGVSIPSAGGGFVVAHTKAMEVTNV